MFETYGGHAAFRDYSPYRTVRPADVNLRGLPMSTNGHHYTQAQTRCLTGVQIAGTSGYVPDYVVPTSTYRTRMASIPNGS